MEAAGLREKQKEANPFLDNPFTQGFQAFVRQASTQGAAANPFFAMFAQANEAASPGAKTEPAADTTENAAPDVFSDLLSQMFDSGIEVQKAYQKNVEQIFDGYLSSRKQGRV